MAVRDVNERFTMSLELQNYRAHLQKMVDIKTADLQSSQKALQKAKTEAIDANNAKSEVIANMSHEMRTPLNGVIGLVQLLERSPLNSEQKNYVSRALTSGKQLLATINDILDFAKMESGSVEIYEESFDLSSVVRTVEDSVFVDPDGGVSFECVIDPDVPDNLLGDQFRLGQVLINLVGNGVKFTKAGRVVLKIDAGKWVDGAIQLKFSVCDNGPGITIEKQKRLFEPYYQGDSSVRKNYGGTGLGLSICKKIITSMDGEIGVKDNPIGGSCFWFEIYLKPSDKRVEEKHAQVPESRGNYYQGKTFLLVEDNEINMYLLRTLLQAGGASTLLAANGQEGLDMLAANDVDLVIMDVQMPVLDGYEATKQIRLDPQYEDLPIIAMTANIFSSDVEKCFDAGMDAYLAKPFTVTDLDEVVRANLKN